MSTGGDNLSISVASHTANLFTKQLPVMNITSQPRLVSRMVTKFSMLDVVSVDQQEKLPSSLEHISLV